jgi:hypothetical protein
MMDSVNKLLMRLLLVSALTVVCGSAFVSLFGKIEATENSKALIQLLSSASTIHTTSTLGQSYGPVCREMTFYIQWSSGTSDGTVLIETAHIGSYAGAWAPLTEVAWSEANSEDIVQITGVMMFVRTRVSEAIVGGTVSTWAVCN